MKRLIRFSLVGVLNTLLHLAVFYWLLTFAQWHYLAASGMGFTVAVINSFVFNKFWTFAVPDGDLGQQFLRFVLVSVAALVVNLLLLSLLVDGLLWRPEPAQVVAVLVTLMVNFNAVRLVVFSPDAIVRDKTHSGCHKP